MAANKRKARKPRRTAPKASPAPAPAATPNIPDFSAVDMPVGLGRNIMVATVRYWLENCAALLQQKDKEKLVFDILTSYHEPIRLQLTLIESNTAPSKTRH